MGALVIILVIIGIVIYVKKKNNTTSDSSSANSSEHIDRTPNFTNEKVLPKETYRPIHELLARIKTGDLDAYRDLGHKYATLSVWC